MSSLSPDSPTPSLKRRRKGYARRCERSCWTVITFFPLAFVYGLTTWAVCIHGRLSWMWIETSWKGYLSMFVGVGLYILLNWSYSVAVFTDPGSPLSPPTNKSTSHGYSHLPTYEPDSGPNLPSFTVKSTGGSRFCKKCQARKPDRAHHCSTCRRCVLKMDHHCPWLATCVGLKNYKPFLLFCSYTTLFCWLCCGVSATFFWTEIANEAQFGNGFMPVNMILLCVLAGILGFVLAGFTGWHLSLAWRGQTTIECLEKTRYLSTLRRSMQGARLGVTDENGGAIQRYGQQLAEIHANALPGVTRIEEGEERRSPTADLEQGTMADALNMTYDEEERSRERQRYEDYLDEQDSEKLPNAFDLGWRRNLRQLFGDEPLFWLLPICNTQGDGWHWEPSPKWLEAREGVRHSREVKWQEQELREQRAGWGGPHTYTPREAPNTDRHYMTTSTGVTAVPSAGTRSTNKANQILGRSPNDYSDAIISPNGSVGSGMSMKTLRRKSSFGVEEGEEDYGSGDEQSKEVSTGQTGQPEDRSIGGSAGGVRRQHNAEEEWRDWD